MQSIHWAVQAWCLVIILVRVSLLCHLAVTWVMRLSEAWGRAVSSHLLASALEFRALQGATHVRPTVRASHAANCDWGAASHRIRHFNPYARCVAQLHACGARTVWRAALEGRACLQASLSSRVRRLCSELWALGT